jgi:dTDP-4-dehydrorhamnose reductase
VPSGIYHFSPDGHASWQEFASSILPDFHPITPIRAAEYSTHLARPACSRLDNRKIKALGMATHHWRAGLAACLKEYRHAAS